MKIYLVRHGETEENVAGIIQGHLHGKLTSDGIIQAKKAAQWLKNEAIDVIYSSDLARAADTAREIATFHSEAEIHFTVDLRERYWAEIQGKHKDEVRSLSDKLGLEFLDSLGGETIADMWQRAKRFYDFLISNYLNNNVLLVGHNGINKTLVLAMNNKSADQYSTFAMLNNAAICIFDIDEHLNCKTLLYNGTAHYDIEL